MTQVEITGEGVEEFLRATSAEKLWKKEDAIVVRRFDPDLEQKSN